jgi:hypothetical protein
MSFLLTDFDCGVETAQKAGHDRPLAGADRRVFEAGQRLTEDALMLLRGDGEFDGAAAVGAGRLRIVDAHGVADIWALFGDLLGVDRLSRTTPISPQKRLNPGQFIAPCCFAKYIATAT